MKIPNALKVDGGLVFVPEASDVAERVGRAAVCARPPAYERFTLQRIFWQELGMHYDEMPRREIAAAVRFLELERKHPARFTGKTDA